MRNIEYMWLVLLLIPTSIIEITALIYAYYAFISVMKGAPYVPTTNERLRNALKLASFKPGMRAADLGSGDGKVVVELARRGCTVDGYEINPFLVWWSRHKIKKAGLQEKATIRWTSFWKVDFSQYDLIFIYGITCIMKLLSDKLKQEAKPGCQIISIVFPLPSWTPQDSHEKIYLYNIYKKFPPASVLGVVQSTYIL